MLPRNVNHESTDQCLRPLGDTHGAVGFEPTNTGLIQTK